jgi:hypothetical protein
MHILRVFGEESGHFGGTELVDRHQQLWAHCRQAVLAAQVAADMEQHLGRHFCIGLGAVGGALSTICWLIPVSEVIKDGMRTPQLTSDT